MKKENNSPTQQQGLLALVVTLVALQTFVLAQFVENRNNAQHSKSEQAYNAECYCPTLTIVNAFDEHHEAQNGDKDGGSKKWKFHDRNDLLQK